MHIARCWLYLGCVISSALAISTPAMASFTHYYYDAQGRLLGALSTADEQRTSRTDNADNPSFLHVFPNAPPTSSSTLPLYGSLVADQSLTSADGRFTFVVQENGNATVYYGSSVLWSTYTAPVQPGLLAIEGDGNIYFYGPDESVIWRTNVSNSVSTNAQLIMESTGDLILFQNGVQVWHTNTGGH